MKFNVGKVLKNLTKFAVKHQPEILQAMGFATGATALVLTATGTVKAVREIDEKQPATKTETAKIAAKHYIPAAGAAMVSFGFHIAASKSYIKRNTMLASYATMMYDKYNKLEEKNIEVLGDKKANEVKDHIASDEIKHAKLTDVVETGHGHALFLDGLTGQVIRSDYGYIQKVVNDLNAGIANAIAAERGDKSKDAHYPSVWEWETLMGERETNHANHYGWYDGTLIRVNIRYEKHESGESIGYIDHKTLWSIRPEYMYIAR